MPSRPYEIDDNIQMQISIERNLDLTVIARNIYNVFDYISDIGGMLGILVSSAALFLHIWTYNDLEDYMVTRLYKVKKAETDGAPVQFDLLKESYCCSLKAFLRD